MIKRLFAALFAVLLTLGAASAFAAVDANKATQAELETVKGIGPSISGKILDERKKANFKDWSDLVERVKGVGDGNAAKFSTEGLTVNGQGFKGAAAPAAKPAKADKAAAKSDAPAAAATPAAMPAAKATAKTGAASAPMSKADSKAAAKAQKDEEKAAKAKLAADEKAAKAKATADAKAAKMAAKPDAAASAAKK